MGVFDSISGLVDDAFDVFSDLGDIVSEGVDFVEDTANNKAVQQVAAAGIGFALGGAAGAYAAQQTTASVQQGREAEKVAEAQEQQRKVQQRQANVRAVRQRAQALRERRLAESTIVAQGEAFGISGSAIGGASADVQRQSASNIGIINSNIQSQNEMFDLADDISNAYTAQNRAAAYGNIGTTIFNYSQRKK